MGHVLFLSHCGAIVNSVNADSKRVSIYYSVLGGPEEPFLLVFFSQRLLSSRALWQSYT